MFSNKRIKMKQIVIAFLFLLLLINVFVSVTYLFENKYGKQIIAGLEKEKNLDMIYIGGSATFVYWEPLKAWNDCGFTSYNLAYSNMQAESIKYHVKQGLRKQNPKLFVIDARPFQYYEDNSVEAALRTSSDSFGFFSIDRLMLLNEYLDNHDMDETSDRVSFYFNIMKYHTNYEVLSSSNNWNTRGGGIHIRTLNLGLTMNI